MVKDIRIGKPYWVIIKLCEPLLFRFAEVELRRSYKDNYGVTWYKDNDARTHNADDIFDTKDEAINQALIYVEQYIQYHKGLIKEAENLLKEYGRMLPCNSCKLKHKEPSIHSDEAKELVETMAKAHEATKNSKIIFNK